MIWLMALMMMLSCEPAGEVLPPGEIGPVETTRRDAPLHMLTLADLGAYQTAGEGETWRSGALTWPLLDTAHAALGEAARFGVIYRNHALLLPDYPSFYAPGAER